METFLQDALISTTDYMEEEIYTAFVDLREIKNLMVEAAYGHIEAQIDH